METSELIRSLQEKAKWIRFVGVVLVIVGVLSVITIFGVLYGIIQIWLGVILLKASDGLNTYQTIEDDILVKKSIDQIALFFKVSGIAIIVIFVVLILLFAGYIFLLISFTDHM